MHEVGAGNPEGVDIEEFVDDDGVPLDSVPFFPYKVLNALVGIGVFMTVFAIIMFFTLLQSLGAEKFLKKKINIFYVYLISMIYIFARGYKIYYLI